MFIGNCVIEGKCGIDDFFDGDFYMMYFCGVMFVGENGWM